ncbi:MAG: T9SS C-terminal target domain-containing protein [Cytophagales bacterium]|nr:MAG: T9SS C-terminal target domain-containing protein [Cytophagales bacterium]
MRIFISIYLFFSILVISQNTYLIYLKDKENTQYYFNHPEVFLSKKSINRRIMQNIKIQHNDLPINQNYVSEIQKKGASIWYKSKWMNAVYVKCDTASVRIISKLEFVNSVKLILTDINKLSKSNRVESSKATEKINFTINEYGNSYQQINSVCIDKMHEEGFKGEGMLIAVTDGGFTNTNSIAFLDSLFINSQIKGTYDFVRNQSNVYDYSSHGTHVLSLIAGNISGKIIGSAPKADFYLFRTENDGTENIVEEVNWAIAAEKADSLGVDIINVSLGYTTFDNPSDNHTYSDMNGNTTIITKAADIAASKGMIVVVSAGNSGASSWKYISAPSDADSVLAVGAVNNMGIAAAFSGHGPSADGRIKPDVTAQGVSCLIADVNNTLKTGNGTSYSAPIITGLVAGLWQANRNLTNMEIIKAIKKSGSLSLNPNTRMGYGIPCFENAHYGIIRNLKPISDSNERLLLYPNPIYETEFKINISKNDIGQLLIFELYNTSGILVYKTIIENAILSNAIDLKNMQINSGFFVAKIIVGNTIKVLKLTKK